MSILSDLWNQQYITKPSTYKGPSPFAIPSVSQNWSNYVAPRSTAPMVSNAPAAPVVNTPVNNTPIFSGNNPPAAPVAPVAPAVDVFAKYRDPQTGKIMTPEEYAVYLGNKIPVSKGGVVDYATNQRNNPNQTTDQLTTTARDLNNARNDLAVGETSLFAGSDVTAGGEKIIYSPAEQIAIRKAEAGIYDPVLSDVFNKLDKKQRADAAKEKEVSDRAAQVFATDENIRQWNATTGSKIASGTGDYNLTTKQQQQLMSITNKYSADSTINQGLMAIQIKNITKAINANPNSSGNQLIALYTIVKNLDPDSAVREGELDLAQKTNSYLGKFQDSLTKLSTGRVLNPAAIKELTAATDLLADEWVKTAQRRQKQYTSQANIFGLSEPFNDYTSGYENPDTINSDGLSTNNFSVTDPDGGVHTFPTQEQANAFKKAIGQ